MSSEGRKGLRVAGFLLLWAAIIWALCDLRAHGQSITTQCIANASAGGTPDALTIPALPCASTTNFLILTAAGANTSSAPTLTPLGSPTQVIVRSGNAPLSAGDIAGSGYVALLTSTGQNWVLLNPANSDSPSGAVSPLQPQFGALCNGTGDDTAAFTAAAAASLNLVLPPNVRCELGSWQLGANTSLDCNGSILEPASGATQMLVASSTRFALKHCIVWDPSLRLVQTSTTTASVSPGATTIPLQSTAGMAQNQLVTVLLANGTYWPSMITSVAANSITIADAIPWTLTGATLSSGGSGGFVTGEVLVNGSQPTASGVPGTLNVVASGGTITAITSTDVAGYWESNPGGTLVLSQPGQPQANSATISATYGGVSSGAYVDAAFGAIVVDNANGGLVRDINMPEVGVGIEVLNSSCGAGSTNTINFEHIDESNVTMAAFVKGPGTNQLAGKGLRADGYQHHATTFGAVGMYVNGRGCAVADGGSKWDLDFEGFGFGLVDQGGQVDFFENAIFDTEGAAGVYCSGCVDNDWTLLDATFTGPGAKSGAGSRGFGAVFTNSAINNGLKGLTTHDNAVDLFFGDQVSSVWAADLSWHWSNLIGGFTNSIYAYKTVEQIATGGSVSGLTPTVYLAPGYAGTTEGPSVVAGYRGSLTGMWITSQVAPGSATYSANVRIARWGGSSYGSFTSMGTCTWTGTTPGCLYTGPGIYVGAEDKIDVAVTISSGSFPSGQAFTGFVSGL